MKTGDCFTKAISKSKGKRYYVNTETGLSRWGLPIYDESTELKVEEKVSGWEVVISANLDPKKIYFSNPLEGISQWNLPPKIEHVGDEPLADGWEKRLSKCKNVYYVNKEENRSQWEIPIPIVIIPEPIDIPASTRIHPSIESPIPVPKPTNQPPRSLKWVGNSCYLDSSLFAFFAGPKKFIDNMLDMDLEGVREEGECTVENLNKIQYELRIIYNSITRQGNYVKYCTNLRKSLENCPHKEGFHTEAEADSGEFISYLISLFPANKNFITTKSYYTNLLDVSFEKFKDREDTFKSEAGDLVELIKQIDREEIKNIGKYEDVMLSEFLVDRLDDVLDEDFRADNGIKYIRRVQIRNITFSPYLIFNLMRLKKEGSRKINTNILNPDNVIKIGDQLFFLSGAVMYTGKRHYVAIAKYNDFWWYYNDSHYKDSRSLIRFDTFDDFLSKVSELNLIDPRTHGTQFYYTPVDE